MKQTLSKHEAIRAHIVHVYIEYICMMSVWCLLDVCFIVYMEYKWNNEQSYFCVILVKS